MSSLVREPAAEYLPRYTWEDYARWEGDWELINGIPFAMSPSPSARHQQIASNLHFHLRRQVKEPLRCLFELDWIVSDSTTVRPDLVIVDRPLEGDWITFTPRLVAEILSPSTEAKDQGLKQLIYAEQGVDTYLILDPYKAALTVLQLDGETYREVSSGAETSSLEVAGQALTLTPAELFAS